MTLRTYSSEVFACWAKACAPPPAGKGGSVKGGSWSNKQRVARAKAAGEPVSQGKSYAKGSNKGSSSKPDKDYWNKSEEERRAIDHADIVKAGKDAVMRQDARTNRNPTGGIGGGSVGKKSSTKAPGGDRGDNAPGPTKEALDITKKYGARGKKSQAANIAAWREALRKKRT